MERKLIKFTNKVLAKCINFVYTIIRGDDTMEVRIQKWGNSAGIRIPSSILKSLKIKTNDVLNIEQQEDKIVISIPKKRKSL